MLRRTVALALLYAFVSAFSDVAAAAEARHAAVILDANTGNVLHDDNGDGLRHPASLTKMMTLYLTFETLESGRLKMSDDLVISEAAASVAPSKLDLDPGERISVSDAIHAVITKSANDIAVALAEKIGGSQANFVNLMNARAKEIGMARTHFVNASGLPDDDQVTTARDMITLALHLQDDYPSYFPLFATRSFSYGRKTFRNHNTMLNSFAGIDGIKTGYTRASGFNLVTSFHRGGKHLIGAVFGGASAATRNGEMRILLTRMLTKASSVRSRKPAALLVAKLKAPPQAARRFAAAPAPKAVAFAAPADPKPRARGGRPAPPPAPVASDSTRSAEEILAAMRERQPAPLELAAAAEPDPAEPAAQAVPPDEDAQIEVFKVRKVAIVGSKSKASPDETTDMDTADRSDTVETAYSGAGRTDYGRFANSEPKEPRTLADKLSQAFGEASTPADAETFIPKLASAEPGPSQDAAKMSMLGAPEVAPSVANEAATSPADVAAPAASPPVMPVAYTPPKVAPPVAARARSAPSAPSDAEAAPAPAAIAAPKPVLRRGQRPSTLQAQAMALGGNPHAAARGKQAGGGYLVQIGAYGSANEAQHALEAIKTKTGTLLAGVSPLTQPTEKNGHQIYRARFAGFNADRAASTCNALRRQSVDCFVMAAD